MAYQFRFFQPSDIGSLYGAFVQAFSDYYVNFQPNIDQFYHRIFHKLNTRQDLSGLAFHDEEVVGFILHTINQYEGVTTAYNGGTGIVPGRREQKLSSRLYEMILPRLKEQGAERIVLEVINTNDPAIGFYRSMGFEPRRTFKCFKTTRSYDVPAREGLTISRSFELKKDYQALWAFTPAFLDSSDQLKHNMANEIILEALQDGKLAGYVIFQPAIGRISQWSVGSAYRGMGVGLLLLQAAQALSRKKNITLMNIPENEQETIRRVEALGFVNEVTQHEMIRPI